MPVDIHGYGSRLGVSAGSGTDLAMPRRQRGAAWKPSVPIRLLYTHLNNCSHGRGADDGLVPLLPFL
jgi:hypothetical protein